MSRNNVWVTIGDGVIGVAEGGKNGLPLAKPRGFPLPETLLLGAALTDRAGELAGFIANCLVKSGTGEKKLSLLLGAGVSFYEEYQVNPGSGRKLREEQRGLALDKVIEGDRSSYIIEEISEVANGSEADSKDGLITRAVCGAKYDFLAGLVKALKKRGYRVVSAAPLQAAVRQPERRKGTLPDFTYGGRENRKFGRATTILCVCAVVVAAVIATLQPIQAWQAEADARERWNAIKEGADAPHYEALYEYRQTQTYLPYYRDLTAALDAGETAYGDLLTLLRTGILKGATINELALGEDDGILVTFTAKDVSAFERELELLNESRKMSAAEVGKREGIGKGKNKTWKIQIKISYYTFENSGVTGQ